MIDLSEIRYVLRAMDENGIQYDISDYVQNLGWEENENELSVRLSFTAKNDETSKGFLSDIIKPGCLVAAYASCGAFQEDEVARGYADILRLWVASTDYTGEIAVSDEILKRSADTYRRIRNTARFFLANLNGFDPAKHQVKPEEMVILDRWAVGRAKAAQEDILKHYENYDFHNVIQRLMQFCSVEMGSFYLDIIKDRQYTAKSDSVARRSCQTALYHIIEALVRWMAPIMSFTADEIWAQLPGERAKFVFTQEWYTDLFGLEASETLNDEYWAELLAVRSEVNKVLEQARTDKQLRGSLEAAVTLYADKALAEKLNALGNELRFVLLTSQATVADIHDAPENALASDMAGLKIILSKAQGEKCPRCWHYATDIGQVAEHADLCGRCVTNVAGNGEERKFA